MTDLTATPLTRRAMLAGTAAAAVAVTFGFTGRAHAAEPFEVVTEAPGDATKVSIEKMAYGTPEVKVKTGGAVTWTNNDEIAHNVHFRGGPAKGNAKAQGKMLKKGETYTVKFTEAGTYDYICTPHPMMKAKVVVEA